MTPKPGLRIAYLVHNTADPAVKRRIAMLQAGGAIVEVAGFRRSDNVPALELSSDVIDLGRVGDGRFVERAIGVARVSLRNKLLTDMIGRADVVLARSLELLVCAIVHRKKAKRTTPVVYECLDIHRLMLSNGRLGGALRWIEDLLAKDTAALMTSSPGFVRNYFSQRSPLAALPVLMVENKVFVPDGAITPVKPRPAVGPWRIGWFGALRDRKGYDTLLNLVRRLPGKVEVVMRGIPSEKEFPTLTPGVIEPGVTFEGRYRYETDLPHIYSDVHFAWTVDFFEEGLNSSWLLPNRIYESGLYGSVPIALANVEAGRLLDQYGVGLLLRSEDFFGELVGKLSSMDASQYDALTFACRRVPIATWMSTQNDCLALVERLSSLVDRGCG